MPDPRRDQITQLAASDLDGYAHQLTRCLKALSTTAPARAPIQAQMAAIDAELAALPHRQPEF